MQSQISTDRNLITIHFRTPAMEISVSPSLQIYFLLIIWNNISPLIWNQLIYSADDTFLILATQKTYFVSKYFSNKIYGCGKYSLHCINWNYNNYVGYFRVLLSVILTADFFVILDGVVDNKLVEGLQIGWNSGTMEFWVKLRKNDCPITMKWDKRINNISMIACG